MLETYLGRYAAIQKRNAVAAVLDFTDEEWESLKALREADGAETNQVAMAMTLVTLWDHCWGRRTRMRQPGAQSIRERRKW
jgi:hypothetical protein